MENDDSVYRPEPPTNDLEELHRHLAAECEREFPDDVWNDWESAILAYTTLLKATRICPRSGRASARCGGT